jgi:pimeloyl-ACP methyl ester carboxylesterase
MTMKKIKTIGYVLSGLIALAAVVLVIVFEVNNVESQSMDEVARKSAPGKFISLRGGITHYEIGGSDTAQTVVLVHGFSVPYYIWGGTFDSLVKAGYQVIRYDEFGRGYSDRPDGAYTPAFYRTQLSDLITALKLKAPLTLAGVSFGGAVATDFAVHYPALVDKVILEDPVFNFRKAGAPETVVDFYMALNHEKQATGQLDDFKYPALFPGWVEQYRPQMQYKGFRHALASTLINYSGDSIIANYRKLNSLGKEVLLIWGTEDQTVTYNFSDSLRRILKADFLSVDDAGIFLTWKNLLWLISELFHF